jgi:hypothetical protein
MHCVIPEMESDGWWNLCVDLDKSITRLLCYYYYTILFRETKHYFSLFIRINSQHTIFHFIATWHCIFTSLLHDIVFSLHCYMTLYFHFIATWHWIFTSLLLDIVFSLHCYMTLNFHFIATWHCIFTSLLHDIVFSSSLILPWRNHGRNAEGRMFKTRRVTLVTFPLSVSLNLFWGRGCSRSVHPHKQKDFWIT